MAMPAQAAVPPAEPSPILFLSHAGADSEAAVTLAKRIENAPTARQHDLKVWVDKRKEPGLGLAAGVGWQKQLEEVLGERSTAFAVYLGAGGVVNWVDAEVRLALSRAISRPPYPFIPVIAHGAHSKDLPGFAQQYQGVRYDEHSTEALEQLLRAVLHLDDGERVRLEDEPFLGLRAFDESRSHLFFGRERETARVLWRLRRRRLLMVTGDSGSGKSSLVKAGIVSKWRGGVLAPRIERPNETIWHVVETRPGASPFRELGDAVFTLSEALGHSAEDRGTYKKWAMQGDAEERRDGLRCGLPADQTRTLLVVDQFEELFTQTPPDQRQPFIDFLLNLVDSREDTRFYVVLTMRRDYYNLIHPYEALRERLEQPWSRYTLGRISDTGFRRVVTEPLKLGGVDDAEEREALAKAVLRDVSQQPGDLALVQFALTEAWDRYRDGHRSQKGGMLKAYIDVGGVEGALARAADRLFNAPAGHGRDGLTSQDKVLAESLFIRLVRLGDTGGTTRRLATHDEFSDEAWTLAQKLATKEFHRLLVTGGQGVETVELSHEALVTQWPRYQSWLQASVHLKRILDGVIPAAKKWAAADRSRKRRELATGTQLDDGMRLLRERPTWLSGTERQFLQDSHAAARTQTRRKRVAVAALVLLTGVASAFGWAAYEQSKVAEEQARIAEEQGAEANRHRDLAEQQKQKAIVERDRALISQSRFLADLSRQQLEAGNSTVAILLALEALPRDLEKPERPYVAGAEASLSRAVGAARERLILQGHERPVRTAAFSPDGARVVTASEDGTARIWDAASGRPLLALEGHDAPVLSAAFSPDGARVVTASADRTARIWDIASGGEITALRGHEDRVWSAAFSPDGARVVTASDDRTVRLWDAASGGEITALRGHEDRVWSAAFSPDGTRIVTASRDGSTARIWDAASGEEITALRGDQRDRFSSAAFSPDGQRVVTASTDGTARVWDAATGEELRVLRGHAGLVNTAAFSPDGRRVVTASLDGTARIWDAASGGEITALRSHKDRVWSAAFSPDGRRVVTASLDGTARIWDAASGGEIRGHEDRVWSAAFSPDGARIVTASADRTARIWDAASGRQLAVLRGHTGEVWHAAFSPDGARVVTASDDRTARLWDAASGGEITILSGHQGWVRSAAFSPDGARVVTASEDGTARIWDAASGRPLLALKYHALKGYDEGVLSAAFSPDGARVVTGSLDHMAWIWDAASGRPLLALEGHDAPVLSAAFSPDGRWVVTGSADGTARLWDAASGGELTTLRSHRDWVWFAAFSPDGRRVVTGSKDGTARLWDAASGGELSALRGDQGDQFLSGAFSPDGRRVVTGSKDGTVPLWRIPPSGQTLINYAYDVLACIVMADGQVRVPQLTAEERRQFFLDPEPSGDGASDRVADPVSVCK